METEKDSVKVEEGDVLEQYFSKKSTRVSSWTRSSSQGAKEKGEEKVKIIQIIPCYVGITYNVLC